MDTLEKKEGTILQFCYLTVSGEGSGRQTLPPLPFINPGGGSTNFFRKGPGSKYFRFCEPHVLCCNNPPLLWWGESSCRPEKKGARLYSNRIFISKNRWQARFGLCLSSPTRSMVCRFNTVLCT